MVGNARSCDVIDAGAYSVEELRDAVFKGKGTLSRPLALALLGRKSYLRKVNDLSRLLMDEQEEPRLRNMAGRLLGEIRSRAAMQALTRGLEVKNELALRGVLDGLRLAGPPELPPALSRLKRRKGLIGRVAARTAGLLGHRLGARGSGLAPAPEAKRLRVDPRRSVAIEVRPARGAAVTAAVAALTPAVPRATLVGAGATMLRCAGRDLLLLLEAATQGDNLERFRGRKALLGVVAEKATLEGVGWSVKLHLLSEPQDDGTLRLLAATARGVPAYTGTARIKGQRATFALRSLDRPGAVAVDVQGTFEAGRLIFTQARTNQKRRASLQPAPLEPGSSG